MNYTIPYLKSLCKWKGIDFEYDKFEVAAHAPNGYIFIATDCGVAIRDFSMYGGKQNAINGLVQDIRAGLKKQHSCKKNGFLSKV
jgi:hypothetical protein